MMEGIVEVGGVKIPVVIDEGSNTVMLKGNYRINRELVERLTYGVHVTSCCNAAIVLPKSGLTEEGKQVIRAVYPQASEEVINHNPLPLVILAIILGLAVVCNWQPEFPLCKGVSDVFWKVLMPIAAFGFGAWVGYEVFRRV